MKVYKPDVSSKDNTGPTSMEKAIPGFSCAQDFFELYWILVKLELSESKVAGSELSWEKIAAISQELMNCLDQDSDIPLEEGSDTLFPETFEDGCEPMVVSTTPRSMLEFIDLREIYEKVQSRAGGGSHQRVASGLINIKATSEGQLCGMNVFVQRTPEAASLCGDINGRIPLEVTHENYYPNQQLFSVDLDSVYNTPNGTPVYKLATVDAERRNLFNLVVFLKFIDGTQSEPFISKPFLIRSRKPNSRTNSFEYI